MDIVQPGDDAQLRVALGQLIARPDLSAADVDQQIDVLLRYSDKRGFSLEHCLIARLEGRLLATCLCVDSPGRTSSVFMPSAICGDKAERAVTALLEESARRAASRNLQFLQALVPPEANQEKTLLRRARFDFLAQLIYLEADATQPVLPGESEPSVSWRTYSPTMQAQFAGVVEGTYEGTLDCGSLNGLRDIEDILASHRATGEFDPRFWLIAMVNGHPVGIILLAHIPERNSYEVVYMGILPAYRGKGYGSAVLRRGLEVAQDQVAVGLSLAVDARNTPARKLYQRFGFKEVSRRDAWIRVLPKSGRSSSADS